MAKFEQQVIGAELDFTGEARVDVAISENGMSSVIRKINQLAAASQKLDPGVAASLRGEALRLGLHMESIVKDAAKLALRTVVKTTPHDTGLARANWTVRINQSRPASLPTQETDYEGDETIATGELEIDATDRQPGQIVWISNSAPHITGLEHGHSSQAPSGMTALAKVTVDAYVRRRGIELKGKKI